MSRLLLLLCLSLLALPLRLAAAPQPLLVGLDGEFGLLNSTSAQAIEKGMRIAIEEVNRAGGLLGGRPLQLVTRDNRSVPARGVANIRAFAAMPHLVAVVGGRFSPVILEELPVIHKTHMILLDAWGSADRITDNGYSPNYVFRLSLRDSHAMPAMLRHAESLGAHKLGLLLPNTGWGRSNLNAAQNYAAAHGKIHLLDPNWYNWGERDMLRHYLELRQQGAEAIILVANDLEGSALIRQLDKVRPALYLPIVAHWGVTGGKFFTSAGPALGRLNFSVVQSFSLFRADPAIRARVMAAAKRLFHIQGIDQVHSAVGFGQGYDLVHILARAIALAGSEDRDKVRDALEQVRNYQGLTGDYPRPFAPGRHDAMGPGQVFMARYRKDGVVVPLQAQAAGSPAGN